MPPKVKFSKETMIGTALQLVREQGMASLTVEPLVTISHYELPYALVEKYNGWASRELIEFYMEPVWRGNRGPALLQRVRRRFERGAVRHHRGYHQEPKPV